MDPSAENGGRQGWFSGFFLSKEKIQNLTGMGPNSSCINSTELQGGNGKVQTGRHAGADMIQVQLTGFREQKLESHDKSNMTITTV